MKNILALIAIFTILGSSMFASIPVGAEEIVQPVEVVEVSNINDTHDTYSEIIETFDEDIVATVDTSSDNFNVDSVEVVDSSYSTEKNGDIITTTSNELYSDGHVEQNQFFATAVVEPPAISQRIGGFANSKTACTNGTYWFGCDNLRAWSSQGTGGNLVGIQITCDVSSSVGGRTTITNIVKGDVDHSYLTTVLRDYYTLKNTRDVPFGSTAAYQVAVDARNQALGTITVKTGLTVKGFTVTPL